jgi:magnesium-transporting ATPase (P-type)
VAGGLYFTLLRPARASLTNDIFRVQTETRRDHCLLQVLTTTHSISLIKGEHSGHPVDVEMFRSTGWSYHSPGSSRDSVLPPEGKREDAWLIHRRFEFQPSLQRMSVGKA